MRYRLPPLNALKSFEAAARHESFTKAARELCVTQGAVSHQVKSLEEMLGVRLFQRQRQRLVITDQDGPISMWSGCFDRISMASGCWRRAQRAAHRQHVSNFAAKWLVHRLGGSRGPIPASISVSVPRAIRSTLPVTRPMSPFAMATAIGQR
jgi:LysR family glycine cleavage system transcriptional activator